MHDKSKEIQSPYLRKKQAAQFLNCSERTIDMRREEGEIKCIKKGGTVYFKKSDLIAYMEG